MQRFKSQMTRVWWWAERCYVVLLLTALTQGPVLKLWEGSALIKSNEIRMTELVTYFLAQAPAVIYVLRRGVSRAELRGPLGMLLAFVGWMLLSTLWATLSSHTVIESVSLAVTCLAGLYVAFRFRLIEQLSLFVIGMQPGLLLSWYAVRNDWSGSVQPDDDSWIGIYFNRNSFAPPAALGLLAAAGLLWIVLVRRSKWWIALTALLIDVIILDVALLLRSESSTSLGAVLVFGIVWIFWTIVRWAQRRVKLTPNRLLQSVYPGFLLGVILLTWLGFRYQRLLLRLVGNNLDFTGRTILWRFSWDGFTDRPLFGWGWMSAWQTENFFKRDFWWALTNNTWSHSAVMDVLLGGGLVGAALLVLAIVWSGARQLERVCTQTAGQWSFAATWFVLAAATQESFIVGNHFLWLLLVASMAGHRDDSRTETIVPAAASA